MRDKNYYSIGHIMCTFYFPSAEQQHAHGFIEPFVASTVHGGST